MMGASSIENKPRQPLFKWVSTLKILLEKKKDIKTVYKRFEKATLIVTQGNMTENRTACHSRPRMLD